MASLYLCAAVVLKEPAQSWFLENASVPIANFNFVSITIAAHLLDAEERKITREKWLAASATLDPDHGAMKKPAFEREIARCVSAGMKDPPNQTGFKFSQNLQICCLPSCQLPSVEQFWEWYENVSLRAFRMLISRSPLDQRLRVSARSRSNVAASRTASANCSLNECRAVPNRKRLVEVFGGRHKSASLECITIVRCCSQRVQE